MSENPRSSDEELFARLESIERRLGRLETRLTPPSPAEPVAPPAVKPYSAAAQNLTPHPPRQEAPPPLGQTPLTPAAVTPHAVRPVETRDAQARQRVDRLFEVEAGVAPIKELTGSEPQPRHRVETGVPPARVSSLGMAERFVGIKVLGVVGALALLFATALFMKLAMDRGWISDKTRIAMGTLTGLALFGGAEILLRRRLATFAAVVAGGGIGILTLTNWAAHVLYAFTSFPLAFAFGCGITVFGFGWSILRSQFATLLLAIVGGFLTPVLITRVSGHPWGISLYLGALSAAAALAGARRQWRTPVLLSIVGTIAIFTGWIASHSGHSTFEGPEHLVRWETSVCVTGLTLLFVMAFGIRAHRRGTLGVFESIALTILSLWTALVLAVAFDDRNRDWTGVSYLVLAAALAGVCVKTFAASRSFRATTLTFAILGVTGALPCFFEGAALAISWAVWAAALAWLESRLRAVIPLLGCMLAHALVSIWIGSLGTIRESVEFLWSERSTVFIVEALSLWLTSRALRSAGGAQAWIGRIAMAVMQVFIALLLLVSLPSSRVAVAWCGQALVLAWLARMTRPVDKSAAPGWHLDYAFLSIVVLACAMFRFVEGREFNIPPEATPFVNLRAAFFAIAAAALFVVSTAVRTLPNLGAVGSYLTRFGGVAAFAIGLACEGAFLQSRIYGSKPWILDGELDLGTAIYRVFWNGRFVFLALTTLVFAGSTRLGAVDKDLDNGAGARDFVVAREAFNACATVLAHLTILLALTLEAMGIADPEVGANPTGNWTLLHASNVQAALSIALGVYPALVLAFGFRRSKVHRYFGLTGLLATVVKVMVVDLDGVALEWRMLVFLGLGAALLLGAYLYARAVRRGD